jgi:hypothetical protein
MQILSGNISPPNFHPISIRYTAKEPLGTPDESLPLESIKVAWLRSYGSMSAVTPSKNVFYSRKSTLFPPHFLVELNFANRAAALAGPSGPRTLTTDILGLSAIV